MNHYKTALCGALLAASLLAGADVSQADQAITFTSPSDYYQETGATGNIVGWSFTAKTDLYATRLAVFDTALDQTVGASHFIGLWDSTGQLLNFATVTETSANKITSGFGFQWANITQTLLTANQTYFVGAVMGSDFYTAYVPESLGLGNEAPLAFGDLQVNSGITYGSDAFYYLGDGESTNGITFGSASLTTGINGADTMIGGFGANIDIAPVPEPTTILLFGVGIAGLAGFGRRKK